MTSKVKGFLPTCKIDLEREDIHSEAPVEGSPKVAEISEDLVDSERLIEALNINPELPVAEKKRSPRCNSQKLLSLRIRQSSWTPGPCHSNSLETWSERNFPSPFPRFSYQ